MCFDHKVVIVKLVFESYTSFPLVSLFLCSSIHIGNKLDMHLGPKKTLLTITSLEDYLKPGVKGILESSGI